MPVKWKQVAGMNAAPKYKWIHKSQTSHLWLILKLLNVSLLVFVTAIPVLDHNALGYAGSVMVDERRCHWCHIWWRWLALHCVNLRQLRWNDMTVRVVVWLDKRGEGGRRTIEESAAWLGLVLSTQAELVFLFRLGLGTDSNRTRVEPS